MRWNRGFDTRWTSWAVAVLLAGLAACADTTGSGEAGFARLAVRTSLPPSYTVGVFDLAIDRIRVRVIRPPAASVLDTLVAFPPDQNQATIRLRVPISGRTENLTVAVELSAGTRLLFVGTQSVEFSEAATIAPVIGLQYVGPGTDMTSLAIEPRDSVIRPGESFRVGVRAYAGTTPLDLFYVGWSTSDPATVPIDALGTIRAPGSRGSTMVRAVSPTGIKDSTRISFSPPPTTMRLDGGDGQTGQAGLQLPALLSVRVLAQDQLGVPGIRVRFASLSGGRVLDSLVITDAQGYARTGAVLGPAAGPQSFEARAPQLPVVNFSATAVAGPPSRVVALAGGGQTGRVGELLPTSLVVQVTDGTGNPIGAVGLTWTVITGGGTLVNPSPSTNLSGVGFADYRLGRVPGINVVRVRIASGASADFVATAGPGTPTTIRILTGDHQVDTAGATLAPMAIDVTDSLNNLVPGVPVQWSDGGAGGVTAPSLAITDATGRAATIYRLPFRSGPVTVTASVTQAGLSTSFHAEATAAAPVALAIAGGDGQSRPVSTQLQPFVVRVTDRFGNLAPGATVAWSVVSGEGTLSGAQSVADADGLARIAYTLGPTPGANSVRASLASGAAVTFTATGTAAP